MSRQNHLDANLSIENEAKVANFEKSKLSLMGWQIRSGYGVCESESRTVKSKFMISGQLVVTFQSKHCLLSTVRVDRIIQADRVTEFLSVYDICVCIQLIIDISGYHLVYYVVLKPIYERTHIKWKYFLCDLTWAFIAWHYHYNKWQVLFGVKVWWDI